MTVIDLRPDEYRRITKGEKPPSRWSWGWIDLLIAISLLPLFALAACRGGLRRAVGGAIGVGLWIGGFYSRTIAWLAFIGRVAGL
jgi:hypothetical protein